MGECTGLDVFQDLLGRLNGKSDVVLEKEQKSRKDLKRALYTERRFGALRFVSGGVLVGDRIEKLVEDEKSRLVEKSSSPFDQESFAASQEKGTGEAKGHTKVSVDNPKLTEFSAALQTAASEPDVSNTMMENLEATVDLELENSKHNKNSDKAKRKVEKAQRKLERRQRKETRRAARAECHSVIVPPCTMSSSDQQSEPRDPPLSDETQSSTVVAVTAAMSGRHAVRQRYIRQKKLAVMDLRALNEVGVSLIISSLKSSANLFLRFLWSRREQLLMVVTPAYWLGPCRAERSLDRPGPSPLENTVFADDTHRCVLA